MLERLNNLKLQPRFLLLFALATVLGTLSTAGIIGQVNEMSWIVDTATGTVEEARLLDRLHRTLIGVQTDTGDYVNSGDYAAIPFMVGGIYQADALAGAIETQIVYEDRAAEVEALLGTYDELRNAVFEIQDAHLNGDTQTALDLADGLLDGDGPLNRAIEQTQALGFWVGMDVEQIQRDAADARRAAVGLGVAAIGLFFALALLAALATSSVAQPLLYLNNAIVSYESGAYNAELLAGYERRREEIGQLVTAFNNMVDTIDESNRQREQFLTSARRFIPQSYLDILQKPSIVDLNLGDHIAARMAVMFSDIRGFTTLSEHMTPQENFAFINDYIQQISPAIEEHNGFIVKFLGDGMMALFPYGVEDALVAGLDKERINHEINRGLAARGLTGQLNLGIGIHVGDMMVGMVGESDRLQGDAFSDNVNLTSRIEGLNKTFGTRMIISEEARLRLPRADQYRMRPLGRVQVKGRVQPLSLLEILDAETGEQQQAKLDTLATYQEALGLYHDAQFAAAQDRFKEVLKRNPGDNPAAFYVEQCAYLLEHGTPDRWDGVVVMTTK